MTQMDEPPSLITIATFLLHKLVMLQVLAITSHQLGESHSEKHFLEDFIPFIPFLLLQEFLIFSPFVRANSTKRFQDVNTLHNVFILIKLPIYLIWLLQHH